MMISAAAATTKALRSACRGSTMSRSCSYYTTVVVRGSTTTRQLVFRQPAPWTFNNSGGGSAALFLTGGASSSSDSRIGSFAASQQQQQHRRWYTPLTKEEEEAEKSRVASLTPFQKDQELRKLNRQITKLETLRGINTGELYTWSGRYKQLSRDYGMPLVAYYFTCWSATGLCILAAMHYGGFDAMLLLNKVDARMGWDLSSTVNPDLGKIGTSWRFAPSHAGLASWGFFGEKRRL
jgi:hypothetical protein